VAWERRGGNLYYYRCEREGGRVRKRYIGAGEVAELVAHADATLRLAREQRAARGRGRSWSAWKPSAPRSWSSRRRRVSSPEPNW
jgi:hypothetical protein